MGSDADQAPLRRPALRRAPGAGPSRSNWEVLVMSKEPKKADGEFVLPKWWPTEEELLASLNVPPTPSDRSEVTLIVPSPRPRRSTPEETTPRTTREDA